MDAFFVAYQERTGILMQIGTEVELRGVVQREDLIRMLERLVIRWPQLGQRVRRRLFGLEWGGEPDVGRMIREATTPREIVAWRNHAIDPFTEAPFQVLWVPGQSRTDLAFRTHHAVADGESFFFLSVEALLALAAIRGGVALPPPVPALAPPGIAMKRRREPPHAVRVNAWKAGLQRKKLQAAAGARKQIGHAPRMSAKARARNRADENGSMNSSTRSPHCRAWRAKLAST